MSIKKDVVGSGTGANYIVVAGALHRLINDGMGILSWTGTSGSAMMGAYFASGKTPQQAKELAKQVTPNKLLRPSRKILFEPGVFNIDRIQKYLKQHVAPTIGETQIPLTIVATDSDTGRPVYFSSKKTPRVLLPKAVQASISMPDIFPVVRMGGKRLTDGGVSNNFAIDLPPGPAVGIRVLGAASEMKPWKWWGSFNINIISAFMMAAERQHIKTALWKRAKIVTIQSPISGLDFFKLDAAMIERLYKVGFDAVDKKLRSGWSWK
jgi:hypothetical protein